VVQKGDDIIVIIIEAMGNIIVFVMIDGYIFLFIFIFTLLNRLCVLVIL